MIRKSIVAVATAALVLSGTTAVAGAQSAAPYPSSQIPIDPALVQTVQNMTGAPADQAHAGLQMSAAYGLWWVAGTVAAVGSSVLGVGSSLGLVGSSALSS